MLRNLAALLCGVVFGGGLAVSGMTNPAKVQAFLDVTGRWDPSLALVMAGALAISALGAAWARRRSDAWLGGAIAWPERRAIDAPLLTGAALFGAGWGLAGFCPGPALAALPFSGWQGVTFVVSMAAGMAIHRLWSRRSSIPAAVPRARSAG